MGEGKGTGPYNETETQEQPRARPRRTEQLAVQDKELMINVGSRL